MQKWKACLYLSPTQVVQSGKTMILSLDIESVITLFLFEYLNRPKQLQVTLIEGLNENRGCPEFKVTLDKEIVTKIYSSQSEIQAPAESKLAKLPAITLVDENDATTVISGLCSVCRTIVQLSGREEILGFKRGCLAAPAEASVWTKFCEIDSLRFVERLLSNRADKLEKLDSELARFEMHLKQPVRVHNHAKVIQNLQKTGEGEKLEKDRNDGLAIKHQFVEGPQMFLADLILYCVFYFVLRRFGGKEELLECMPLTCRWFELMESIVGKEILDKLSVEMVSTFVISKLYF